MGTVHVKRYNEPSTFFLFGGIKICEATLFE